jgi:hypothetical protein
MKPRFVYMIRFYKKYVVVVVVVCSICSLYICIFYVLNGCYYQNRNEETVVVMDVKKYKYPPKLGYLSIFGNYLIYLQVNIMNDLSPGYCCKTSFSKVISVHTQKEPSRRLSSGQRNHFWRGYTSTIFDMELSTVNTQRLQSPYLFNKVLCGLYIVLSHRAECIC